MLPHRIPSLDGLRAVSILMVITAHMFLPRTDDASPWIKIFGNGFVGVRIFFVISGFLITSLLIKESNRTGTISLKDFYIRRVFRIFPAYYAYLLTLALLTWAGALVIAHRNFVFAGLFLVNFQFAEPTGHWYVGHAWSLSVEEQFYLLWPITFLVLGRARAVGVALVLMAAGPLARFATAAQTQDFSHLALLPALLHHGFALRPDFPKVMRWALLFLGPNGRPDCIMFGCLPALVWDSVRFHTVLQALFRWQLHSAAAFFIFFLDPVIFDKSPYYPEPLRETLLAAGATLVMLWSVLHATSLTGRILNAAPLVQIGVISYSLYLWQELFLGTPRHGWSATFPMDLILTFACAYGSYHLLESPFLRLRARLFARQNHASEQKASPA